MKFIHAADLHLGNPFEGLQESPAWVVNILKNAQTTALTRLVDDAIEQAVDFVLLAGDVFDTTRVDMRMQLALLDAFQQLEAAGIQVVLQFGNHDYVADFNTLPIWPTNVHVLPKAVSTVHLTTSKQERVAVTGFSYAQQHITQAMANDFPLRDPKMDFQIGMYHGAVGVVEQDVYAPFQISVLNEKKYDYWALGHIHVRQTLQETPFIGYSGTLQGLNVKETGPKGYYLVTNEGQQLHREFVPIAPVIWIDKEVVAPAQIGISKVADWIRGQLTDNHSMFALVNLQLQTDDEQIRSLVTNKQLLSQLQRNSQSRDEFYIWRVQLAQNSQPVTLPQFDQAVWEAQADEIFNLENLQEAGLKMVTDPELLAMFMEPGKLAELKQEAASRLHLLAKEVADED